MTIEEYNADFLVKYKEIWQIALPFKENKN